MSARGPAAPATPKPSATVLLLRDARTVPEMLLLLRHQRTAFGASHVFPGGLLEPDDREAHARCAGVDAATAAKRLRLGNAALDYYSAAIRELFEETGVLLARHADGRFADTEGPAAGALQRARQQLHDGKLAWVTLLERFGLMLACDCLHYFAHWVTPRRRRRRFTTRFFAALLPDGQVARHDGRELQDSAWFSVEMALGSAAAGEILLPQPTLFTLRDLRHFAGVTEIIDWARRCEARGVERCMPAIIGEAGRERVVMPDSPDYPEDHRHADRGRAT